MIELNYLAIVVCAVLSMVVGFLWYGPIFGEKWLEIIGASALDKEKRKEMQKRAMPLYAVQFVLSLFQLFVLAFYFELGSWLDLNPIHHGVLLWAAFIMPTIAGSSMWNNNPSKIKWAVFLIQSGYQLVMFVLYGAILGFWK